MSEVRSAARRAVEATAPDGLGAEIEALPSRGMITLRGDFEDERFAAAVENAVGGGIPPVRKARMSGADRGALWMSPDELLLYVPHVAVAQTLETLRGDLGDSHALAVDVSDARAIFRIGGEKARVVLAKGAPVDLAPSAFGVGDLRRTRIGLIAAAFYMTGEEPDSFEAICFRSYAPYLWRWLCEAAKAEGLGDLAL